MILFGKPKNSEDLIYKGVAFLDKNQAKAAIALFNEALKANPKNTSALYNKGQALNQIRKFQDAITCFDKILEINPKDAPALNNRAIIVLLHLQSLAIQMVQWNFMIKLFRQTQNMQQHTTIKEYFLTNYQNTKIL